MKREAVDTGAIICWLTAAIVALSNRHQTDLTVFALKVRFGGSAKRGGLLRDGDPIVALLDGPAYLAGKGGVASGPKFNEFSGNKARRPAVSFVVRPLCGGSKRRNKWRMTIRTASTAAVCWNA
jgi:hypothetical protein